MSTQAPVDELTARWSSIVELATTSTPGNARGTTAQSSVPELPADETTKTPRSTSPATAESSTSDGGWLHDITATAGAWASVATWSKPASSDESVPAPVQSSTLIARI